jgi:glycosyltransferase involved in cell wall biosynthesis
VRILVLNQYFHPDRSATSQLLTELCEDLSVDHEVFVVTGTPSYDPVFPVSPRGVVSRDWHRGVRVARVRSTTFDRTLGMGGRIANHATYLAGSVIGSLVVRKPDIVVALTDPPPVGLIGLGVARFRRVPFVLIAKDVFPDVAVTLGHLTDRNAIAVLRAMSRRLFHGADRIVSIGRDMDRRLSELGVPSDRITTIHDWSDGEAVRPLEGMSILRAEQGWDDRFVVMHSGNVGLSQDLGTLIEAADLLHDEEDLLFAIVGEGAAKAGLQAEVQRRRLENVAFLPYQPKDTLSDSLGAADVHFVGLRRGLTGFIVPSKIYGIMAAGKPFIATTEADAEPALIVAEHDCGLHVDPGDPKALAQAILDARGMDLPAMGERARRGFEARFDRPIAVHAYRSLLEEVGGASGEV